MQNRRGQDEHMFALRRLGKVGWGVASAQHWDEAYTARGIDGVSWYEPIPAVSLELVEALGVSPEAAVIDVGGGRSSPRASSSVAASDVTVLDISAAAPRCDEDGSPMRPCGASERISSNGSRIGGTSCGTTAPSFTSSSKSAIAIVTSQP